MGEKYDVAVIGAGIVGTCCAAWIQRGGKSATLIDRNEPGSGTSSGNAGTIASHACVPVNNPAVPFALPALMFGSNRPLAMDVGYVLTHLPWMAQFLMNCLPSRVEAITRDLASLLRHSEDGLLPLIDDAGLRGLMRDNGMLHVYRDEMSWRAGQGSLSAKRKQGVEMRDLTAAEIEELEPNLGRRWKHGVQIPGLYWTTDPEQMTVGIAESFQKAGGHFLKANAKALNHVDDGTIVIETDNGQIIADEIVLAAGAFSTRIGGNLVEPLPLETERGYHVMFPGAGNMLSRPVSWPDAGFYLTPAGGGGLRAAGTVEIAGLDKPPTPSRLGYLESKARELLPELGQAGSTWLGFRPTLPDARPVIGRSKRTPNIILAFGHQHLGLTLGGITGRVVADIIYGDRPEVDLTPFRAARFG